VALTPANMAVLAKIGLQVIVERGAGVAAGFPDADYESAGARLVADRSAVFAEADIVTAVRLAGADDPATAAEDVGRLREGQVLIAAMEPLWDAKALEPWAPSGARAFALELIPRITRAQSMDILSSMATVAGYKGVLLAASALPRMFPMMMTAAGTLKPAKVLVVGAGVAGLQAIATAKRNGAVVSGYDVRAAVKEQVESLGAKFVELPLDTSAAEGSGGYAKEQSEEQVRRQQELMADVVAESDVVITTAAIPGRKSPVIVTTAMVERMAPGSVIVDLAAERGGNCELTKAGETILHQGVSILGPVNLPATVPYHASQMFARNVQTLLQHLVSKEGALKIDIADEITAGTLVTDAGKIRHPQVAAALGITLGEGGN
jgi:NAD(P) transhydrogenase subunit alpha